MQNSKDLFEGRVARKTYVVGTFSMFILLSLVTHFSTMIPAYAYTVNDISVLVKPAFICIAVFLLVMLFSLHVRRLHDLGWSGWWVTFLLLFSLSFAFIPLGVADMVFFLGEKATGLFSLAYFLVTILLMILPASDSGNKYGMRPDRNESFLNILLKR